VTRNVDGRAGCRQLRKAQQTGTMVGLYDAADAGLDADAGRWATVCEEHGSICNHETLELARWHSADPAGWCEECRAALDSR
jgi:hypothetical protein